MSTDFPMLHRAVEAPLHGEAAEAILRGVLSAKDGEYIQIMLGSSETDLAAVRVIVALNGSVLGALEPREARAMATVLAKALLEGRHAERSDTVDGLILALRGAANRAEEPPTHVN